MARILVLFAIILCLPGCAVVGVGLAAIVADNIAQGEDSYTNQALDWTCNATVRQDRLEDGTCPSPPERGK